MEFEFVVVVAAPSGPEAPPTAGALVVVVAVLEGLIDAFGCCLDLFCGRPERLGIEVDVVSVFVAFVAAVETLSGTLFGGTFLALFSLLLFLL